MLAGLRLASVEGGHARTMVDKNKLANNNTVELSTADMLARLKAGL